MTPPCPSASCIGTATAIAALHWQMPAQHPLPCQLLGTVNLELGPPLLCSGTRQDMCPSQTITFASTSSNKSKLCQSGYSKCNCCTSRKKRRSHLLWEGIHLLFSGCVLTCEGPAGAVSGQWSQLWGGTRGQDGEGTEQKPLPGVASASRSPCKCQRLTSRTCPCMGASCPHQGCFTHITMQMS